MSASAPRKKLSLAGRLQPPEGHLGRADEGRGALRVRVQIHRHRTQGGLLAGLAAAAGTPFSAVVNISDKKCEIFKLDMVTLV